MVKTAPRKNRKAILVSIGVLAAVVLLYGALALAVMRYLTPERARSFAASALSRALSREVRMADARVSLWPPFGIDVGGLAVSDPAGFRQGTLLSARRVRLGLSGWALLRRQLVIEAVDVEAPSLRLWRLRSGKGNWEDLGPRAQPGTPAARSLETVYRSLRLRGGQAAYYGKDLRLAFFARDLDADVRKAGSDWRTSFRVGQIGNPKPIPYLNRPIEAKIWLEHAAKGMPVPFRAEARSGDLSFSGAGTAAPSRVEILRGRLTRQGAPASLEDLRAVYRADASGSRIERVAGRIGKSRFEAATLLEPAPVRGTLRADLDLADVSRFLPPEKRGATGRAALAVRYFLRGTDLRRAQLEGAATLANVSLPAQGLDSPALTGMNGKVLFTWESASTTDLSGRFGSLPFRVNARVEQPLALVTALDPNRAANDPIAVVHFELSTGPIDTGRIFPSGQKLTRAPAVYAEGVLRTAHLHAGRLDADNVVAQMVYNRGLVTLGAASGVAYGGNVTGTGRFDFQNPSQPVYQATVQGQQLDAPALLAAWTPLKNLLTGQMDVSLNLQGSSFEPPVALRRLTLDALAHSINGHLTGAPLFAAAAKWTGLTDFNRLKFQDFLWRIRIERGRALFRDAALHTSDGDYALGGWAGLDGTLGLTVSAVYPPEKLTVLPPQIRSAAGFFTDEKGRLLLDFAIEGTVKNPRFVWRTDRLAEGFARRLEAQLLGGLLDPLQKALGDTMRKSQPRIENILAAAVDQQHAKIIEDAARSQAGLERNAWDWVAGLLRPGSSADTARAAPPLPPARDTTAAPQDTVPPPPDTTRSPRDTIPSPPDTSRAP